VRTALISNSASCAIAAVHPFHPLKGISFEVLKTKIANRSKIYFIKTGNSVESIQECMTDHDPEPGHVKRTL
jgi:hypothetical protein